MTEVLLAAAVLAAGSRDLGDLSLEQLSNVSVSTVSGRTEPLSRALGSIYVIEGDDIRRSGATSLPEALRLAPNLQVARTGPDGWAITARGFNGPFANKLLVLMDGRTLYTPTFAGVFWDAQDLPLENIDRIEVISGPGGVLWGANAVNGVINVVTKSSAATRDVLVTGGLGDEESRVVAQWGDGFTSGAYRAYGLSTSLDDSPHDRLQGGFRTDFGRGRDAFTVQGDLYASGDLHGGNVLARWSRDFENKDTLRVQAYYDDTSRDRQKLDTADVQLDHLMAPRGGHSLLWGAGARHVHDRVVNDPTFAFLPPDKILTSWNVYVQDEIAFSHAFVGTFGVKLDRNDYTGVEVLPSVRFGWQPRAEHLVWAAFSRALRAPSRFDRELFLPGTPPFLLAGGPEFESEVSWVYELGYRGQLSERFSFAATAYYDDLDDQRSIAPGGAGATIENDRQGHAWGIETWGAFRVLESWRLHAGYNYLDRDLAARPGTVDLQPESSIGSDPKQWLKIRSVLDIGRHLELDLMLRYYDRLENIDVPSYTAVDGRLGWSFSQRFELSVLVRNLFDRTHVEWSPGEEIDRSYFVKALVRF
jgi:iron complex outermembrane receptor protein